MDSEETEVAAKEKAEEGEEEKEAEKESGAVAGPSGPTNYQKRKLRAQQKKGRAKRVKKGEIENLTDQLAACSSGKILNFVNLIRLKLNFIFFSNFLRWWELGPSSEFNVFMALSIAQHSFRLFVVSKANTIKIFSSADWWLIFPTRQRCWVVVVVVDWLIEGNRNERQLSRLVVDKKVME